MVQSHCDLCSLRPRTTAIMRGLGWLLVALVLPLFGQSQTPQHGRRPALLVISNAMMIEGNSTPAEGPVDIIIKHNRIELITRSRADADYRRNAEAVIEANGKYVLPGFINLHGHLQDERAGKPLPFDYQYKLWLGCGITTVRDLGSDYDKALAEKRKSAANLIAAPRLWLYFWCPGGNNEAEIRAKVRELKAKGADGLKCHQMDRDTYLIVADEAKKLGLKLAHHAGVEDANAWHDAQAGTATIEHWYGVPDAALDGVQQFPPDFNYNNELHRFRHAGRLWREVNSQKLKEVLQALVQTGVAWDPTLCIYEACRDLQRALTQPWFKDYLHPALAAFFQPNPDYHGSFFHGWTSSDEVYWKENFRLWMQAIREFSRMGGIVTTGEDAGFIYQIYGFGYLRELELHEEAGFHPLEVIKHATANGALVLGQAHELGRLKPGYLADVIVVNGNPLENLHVLFPAGSEATLDQQRQGGGLEWTIKDGIPYHAPTLFAEVKEMVNTARQAAAQ